MTFERPHSIALRGFAAAVWLAVLAGCISHSNPTAPVPVGLAATPDDAAVTLTWTASSGATSYNIKRSTVSGGPYTKIASPTAPPFKDSPVTNGTTYYYVVSALYPAGESVNSAEVSATPKVTPPVPPINLTASAGNATVALSWTASSGATSYNVKRATTNGGPYTQLAASTSTAYTDSSTTNGTTYYYVVSALNAGGESANSGQASATPVAPSAPPVPTNLAATAGDAQVSLTWTASGGATSYHVKRAAASAGPYTQIAAPVSNSYTDTSLVNDKIYYYVVSALNAVGESANSAQATATPTVTNPPPTTFGTWINVTPAGMNLTTSSTGCGNAGSRNVQKDPVHPSNLYTKFDCQGVWKSTDYGATWNGPINTGSNAADVSDCEGGITISPASTASVPTIYQSCIRGSGVGFWKSVDGGVNWTRYVVAPSGARQDYNPAFVDPYDQNHLVMTGHEMDFVVESVDGGQNWTNVPIASGMMQNGGTGFIFFINSGSASTTRGNYLWIGGGAWRTSNDGATWVQVDNNGHIGGTAQIYQPGTDGVVYMGGQNSALGSGVLRSIDYGQTWTHVGLNEGQNLVFGSSKNVYALAPGGSGTVFEIGAQPGTGTWVSQPMPAAITTDPGQGAVVNDGTHNILVAAMWQSGVWRYIEP